MAVPRIYTPHDLATGQAVLLSAAASHHLLNVLRLTPSAPVTLFNGKEAGEYQARLIGADKKQAKVHVESYLARSPESGLALHLGQGIATGERMDFIIQKAVELGVHSITPLITTRSRQFGRIHLYKRWEHWQKVVISACEQCGRNELPRLHTPLPLIEWVAQPLTPMKLLFQPDETLNASLPVEAESATLLIGPEGGFTDTELAKAEEHDFIPLSLGPRILRTETAALAAVTALQCRWGDFHDITQ